MVIALLTKKDGVSFPLFMPDYRYRKGFHTVFIDVECLSELSLSCVLSLA